MKPWSAWVLLGIWAAFAFLATLYGLWQGLGGPAFASTVVVFVYLLLVMLLFAGRGFAEGVAKKLGPAGGFLFGAAAFTAYLFYLVGTGTFALERAGVMAAFVFIPLGLAVSSGAGAAGSWQDFLTIAVVWLFVKFGPAHWLWPYPGGRLSYLFTVMLAVNVALATFLLLRQAKGVGYSMGWGKKWGLYTGASFLLFGCIAIPLGMAMRFIEFSPQVAHPIGLVASAIGILLFTAWPEELLFRGLLQNFLSKASKSDFAGWWTASMLFGFAHITNQGFPNWRYVILAAIAGLFYGWTWRKTGSIYASALVHAAVDILWHALFRTL